jgi:hypothetical protein
MIYKALSTLRDFLIWKLDLECKSLVDLIASSLTQALTSSIVSVSCLMGCYPCNVLIYLTIMAIHILGFHSTLNSLLIIVEV